MSKRIKELHAVFSNVFVFMYPIRLTNKGNGIFFTPFAQAALTLNEAQKAYYFGVKILLNSPFVFKKAGKRNNVQETVKALFYHSRKGKSPNLRLKWI